MLGSAVGLDRIGQTFLFLTSVIWLAGGLYARASVAESRDATRFFTVFLLAMAGNLGLVIAQDMVLFYVCFALMGFATYGLVVHPGDPASRLAGRVYLVFVVIGEMALLTALLLAWQAAGSLEFSQVRAEVPDHGRSGLFVAMVLIGFGIKAGAIGLHVWMPLAYRATPIPGAAVLSGAMFSAGLLGWLRMLPMGAPAPDWGRLLVMAGLAAAFYGVIVGLTQRHPKTVLAYSSMSQMGLMSAGLGIALALPEAWPTLLGAVVVFGLHHALAKASLFLGIGVANAADRRHAWLVGAGLVLPALALAGAPGTSGALAKAMLKGGAAGAEPTGEWLYAALPWTSLATTLLLSRFLWLAWPRPSATRPPAPRGLWIPWTLLLAAVAAGAWWSPWGSPVGLWAPAKIMGGLWPIALGAILALLVGWIAGHSRRPLIPAIPPGDLLVPLGFVARRMLQAGRWLGQEWLPRHRAQLAGWLDTASDSLARATDPTWLEARLTRWRAGMLFYLLLAIVLATIMIAGSQGS
jgi:formate hydrogenlyase subunit 3/multisubunit Na+/H+ antiporter MnhD subunit